MTETKNFGFQKPDPADRVDVGVINENFDKVDKALTPYIVVVDKDINMNYAAGEEETISAFILTDLLTSAAEGILTEGGKGRAIQLILSDSTNGITAFKVALDEMHTTSANTVFSGVAPNPAALGVSSRFDLEFTPLEDGSYKIRLLVSRTVGGSGGGMTAEQAAQIQANTDAIAALPISVNADTGYTQIEGLPRATNVDSVQDGNTVNMTITMQDGSVINGVLVLNDSGEPVSYTEDGITCTFTHTVVTEEGG